MVILDTVSPTADMWANSGLGVSIVVSALSLLIFAFTITGNLSKRATAKRSAKHIASTGKTPIVIKDASEIPANEIAAIAMALSLYTENVHDNESNVITIRQLQRNYSPWNSKAIRLLNTAYRRKK
ncbi:MAG: OadG family protein [Dysgonamonadaceae bacterium]|jgi:Na+-transporting methylmalonyl-CoA/oxaloacetate decarboxylase gamma subunit|nr:OadG family protein [Dysgonamonadaceae bacterium]